LTAQALNGAVALVTARMAINEVLVRPTGQSA
jgi:hypothetical protein